MHLYVALAVVLTAGPFGKAIDQVKPIAITVSTDELPPVPEVWKEEEVGGVMVELPVPKVAAYERKAPANYKIPVPNKVTPKWCPAKPEWRHGYSCGMQQYVEDLVGHLQTTHGLELEYLNELGRDRWQDVHDDEHWKTLAENVQAGYLNPPRKPIGYKKVCNNGKCSYVPVYE